MQCKEISGNKAFGKEGNDLPNLEEMGTDWLALSGGRVSLGAVLGAESGHSLSSLLPGLCLRFLYCRPATVEITPLALSSASTLWYLLT